MGLSSPTFDIICAFSGVVFSDAETETASKQLRSLQVIVGLNDAMQIVMANKSDSLHDDPVDEEETILLEATSSDCDDEVIVTTDHAHSQCNGTAT